MENNSTSSGSSPSMFQDTTFLPPCLMIVYKFIAFGGADVAVE